MDANKQLPDGPKSGFSLYIKILVPVLIGLCVVAWLFRREFNPEVWRSIHFDTHTVLFIALAWLFMIGRDTGLTWRFRTLTDRQLTWGRALRVNMLCEFTSAVTPSAVGGSAFGMIYLNREGIELGRATTLMFTTLFLDELFFVVSIPVIMLLIPYGELFGFDDSAFTTGLQTAFWIIYAIIFLWTALLFLGILVKPQGVRRFLNWVFSFKLLRRWQGKIDELGNNMETTGKDLRRRPLKWWLETFGATAMSWCSRYLVVNALFLAFVPSAPQLIVFGRQFVVWVVLMASPTPGGSGVSEWLFTTYYGDLIHSAGMALVIALFWRIISYYIYLVVGACIVPGWVKRGYDNIQKNNKRQ
ncbi:MAG: lysylphosphatidylglycerol synthase transmembrane domain-containing protein [Duncaniella sp.]|nr:lysylphosphatidylglycerol synthase transmembrane domain-containing protein [Duncaniella sp.]HBI57652.1 TIGR00374 family protein [Porphyromonadaceae bacterium]